MIKRYLLKFFCNRQPENTQTILEQLNLSLFRKTFCLDFLSCVCLLREL